MDCKPGLPVKDAGKRSKVADVSASFRGGRGVGQRSTYACHIWKHSAEWSRRGRPAVVNDRGKQRCNFLRPLHKSENGV